MVTAAAASTGDTEQTLVIDLPFPAEEGLTPFTRADVVFTGVDHSEASYEVRLFLNNPAATASTPRRAEQGYAGRFTIFGHGGCYGDEGHCEVPAPSTDPTDLRPAHPLTPLDTYVTITDALRRILAHDGALRTVTLVPVSITPRRADRRPAPELLRFADVTLRTYLTSTEADAEPSDQ
jgi:tyrosinase